MSNNDRLYAGDLSGIADRIGKDIRLNSVKDIEDSYDAIEEGYSDFGFGFDNKTIDIMTWMQAYFQKLDKLSDLYGEMFYHSISQKEFQNRAIEIITRTEEPDSYFDVYHETIKFKQFTKEANNDSE